MASIVERTAHGETDQRLSIVKEQTGRGISIGSSWTHIRIGFRHSTEMSSSVQFSSPPILAFGLCHGTTNMFQDETTDHFLGMRTNGGSWAYTSSSSRQSNNIEIANTAWEFSKKTGNIYDNITKSYSNTAHNSVYTSWSGIANSAWIIEIKKGSPNFEIKTYSSGYGNDITANIDYEKFIASINGQNVNESSGYFYSGKLNGSSRGPLQIPVNETINGVLDTINIAWTGMQALDINDVAYAIIE
jgi:hypothetical protein